MAIRRFTFALDLDPGSAEPKDIPPIQEMSVPEIPARIAEDRLHLILELDEDTDLSTGLRLGLRGPDGELHELRSPRAVASTLQDGIRTFDMALATMVLSQAGRYAAEVIIGDTMKMAPLTVVIEHATKG